MTNRIMTCLWVVGTLGGLAMLAGLVWQAPVPTDAGWWLPWAAAALLSLVATMAIVLAVTLWRGR